jgi:hypothetical protein
MKHLKMLGLAVMAAAALMAFAGSASANPVLTSPAGTDYTGELNATASSSLLLKAGFANITCTESTVSGKVETNNTTHAAGKITTLSFNICGSATVKTLTNGALTVAPGGAVSGSGSEVTVAIDSLNVSCVYGTKTGTALGTLKSGTSTTDATMTINANLPLISGGFACANPANWSGSYTVTKPTPLIVD